MNHLRITIAVSDPLLQEILIALLTELGYEGFEQLEDCLQAYLPEASFGADALMEVLADHQLTYAVDSIPEKNWNEEWERNFSPVIIGDFCAIRANFHEPVAGVAHELVITPKMSFGTGHHATTCMMIGAMRTCDFRDRRVLDFGTGTGVLAILADRLGAAQVLAIDHDDWSIRNAQENIEENGCVNIYLKKMDQVPDNQFFDLILANVNRHVLIALMHRLGQQLMEGGVILMSGLLGDDAEEIENEAANCHLFVSDRMTEGSWICLKLEKHKLST